MADYLCLSAAELLTALAHLGLNEFPQLRDNPTLKLSDAESRGAMLAARDGLLARELAHYDEQGQLKVHDSVHMILAACVRPAATLWLVRAAAPELHTTHTFFNLLPPTTVVYRPDALGLQHFNLLAEEDQVAAAVAQAAGVADLPTGSDGPQYEIAGEFFNKYADGLATPEQAAELRAGLQSRQVTADDAEQFVEALLNAEQRVVALGVTHGAGAPAALSWFVRAGRIWRVREKGDGVHAVMGPVAAAGLQADLTAFVQSVQAQARQTMAAVAQTPAT